MEKPSYHHGDLRNALIAEALSLVEKEGAEAISLRGLAEALGVSHSAPYRHFPDRDALLATVAAKGLTALVEVYETALTSRGNGRTRLRKALHGYVEFARSRPGLHALMFESDFLGRVPPPEPMIAPANCANALLRRGVEDAFPNAHTAWVKARTVTMLSTIVGFLVLDKAGRFPAFMTEPLTRDKLLDAVVEAAIGAGPLD
jgi:AcrR family transcriptional regulator